MKTYVINELGKVREIRSRNVWDNIKSGFKRVGNWFVENKEAVLIFAPVVIGGLTTIATVVGKRSNLHKEEAVKELYCYDRSLGHYWSLKRNLTNREWLEIDARKKNGERLSDILDQLKVLK